MAQTIIGSSEDISNNVVFNKEYGNLISTSFDGKLKIWDYRQKNKNAINNIQMDMAIDYVIISGGKLVVTGISNNQENSDIIKIFSLKNLNEEEKSYESPLKALTTSICAINTGEGFIIGSVEGKIGVEYFNKNREVGSKCNLGNIPHNSNINSIRNSYDFSNSTNNAMINNNYIFKCHREETEDKIITHPILGLCFHPKYNYFFSGGGDKIINGWDNNKRKKFFKSSYFPSPINYLCINKEGTHLAVASSYLPNEMYSDKTIEELKNPQHKIFMKSIENLLQSTLYL
jgi:cell cycle arrest protein BUB3